jgi:very-short-patch-repair endonuclease
MSYFSDESNERFFIKNLERVQGDERDNIIISTGYQKNQSGRLPQNFGPINKVGGQRRLNVAMSRARKRMTLVSSFQANDIDASKNNRGVAVLHAFFTFMQSGGINLLTGRHGEIPLNPFESAIFEKLTAKGLLVEPQFGVSGYRIDFAIRHPELPGRYLLAVEADGASYHSEKTARDRDRLRQEHLERLGWKFHRIWSTDWFRDSENEIAKLLSSYDAQLNIFESGKQKVDSKSNNSNESKSLEIIDPQISRTLSSFNVHGKPIAQVAQVHLDACIRQVIAMNGLITRDEAIEKTRIALGYARKGPAIIQALSNSYDRVQKRR